MTRQTQAVAARAGWGRPQAIETRRKTDEIPPRGTCFHDERAFTKTIDWRQARLAASPKHSSPGKNANPGRNPTSPRVSLDLLGMTLSLIVQNRPQSDISTSLGAVRRIYDELAARPAERQCIRRTECCQFKLTGPDSLPNERRSAPRRAGFARHRPNETAGGSGRRVPDARAPLGPVSHLRRPAIRLPHPFLRRSRRTTRAARCHRFDSEAGNDRRATGRRRSAQAARRNCSGVAGNRLTAFNLSGTIN